MPVQIDANQAPCHRHHRCVTSDRVDVDADLVAALVRERFPNGPVCPVVAEEPGG